MSSLSPIEIACINSARSEIQPIFLKEGKEACDKFPEPLAFRVSKFAQKAIFNVILTGLLVGLGASLITFSAVPLLISAGLAPVIWLATALFCVTIDTIYPGFESRNKLFSLLQKDISVPLEEGDTDFDLKEKIEGVSSHLALIQKHRKEVNDAQLIDLKFSQRLGVHLVSKGTEIHVLWEKQFKVLIESTVRSAIKYDAGVVVVDGDSLHSLNDSIKILNESNSVVSIQDLGTSFKALTKYMGERMDAEKAGAHRNAKFAQT
jgi:hypothetical protein